MRAAATSRVIFGATIRLFASDACRAQTQIEPLVKKCSPVVGRLVRWSRIVQDGTGRLAVADWNRAGEREKRRGQ